MTDDEIETVIVNEMTSTLTDFKDRLKRVPTKEEMAKAILAALYEHDLIYEDNLVQYDI